MNRRLIGGIVALVTNAAVLFAVFMLALNMLTAEESLTRYFGVGLIFAGILGVGMLFRIGRR